ncbi:MAG: hypothetical protein HY456_00135 [Parcubacteria group bacterium]|nr:hypothetical protein [Parcubacteria group bacterium]
MAEATSNLNILVRVRDEASAALSRISGDVSDVGGSLNFAGLKAGILAGALAAISSAAIINGLKSFAEAQAQLAKFDAIIKTLPPNLQKLRETILQVAEDAMMKFGFGNEEAALSIARFMQATNDADFSFKAFQAAMDLARFKGIGLEEATQALIIAFQGGGRILKQFGIEVDEHASKETILEAVLRKVQGQAEAYSGTLQGQISILRQLGNEASETLGSLFAPLIEMVTADLIAWIKQQGGINELLDKHKTMITIAAGLLVGLLSPALIMATVSVLGLLGAFGTLLAWFGVIAAAIIFFAAIWKFYWDDIKNFFFSVWNSIQNFFSSIWNSIVNSIANGFSQVRSHLQSILDFYNNVKNAVSRPLTATTEGVQSGVQSIKNFLGLQHGGIITRPTLAMVGEAGAEAVIPLSRFGMAGGGSINIYLQGDFYTDSEVAERFGNEIARIIKNQLNLAIRA